VSAPTPAPAGDWASPFAAVALTGSKSAVRKRPFFPFRSEHNPRYHVLRVPRERSEPGWGLGFRTFHQPVHAARAQSIQVPQMSSIVFLNGLFNSPVSRMPTFAIALQNLETDLCRWLCCAGGWPRRGHEFRATARPKWCAQASETIHWPVTYSRWSAPARKLERQNRSKRRFIGNSGQTRQSQNSVRPQ
jgi:hypothetical protein